MAVMIGVKPSENAGERNMWEYLEEHLSEDDLCCFNGYISAKEYDFAILRKNEGLFVIDVKEWDRQHIVEVKNQDHILLKTKIGIKPQSSPFGQVKKYAMGFVTHFKNDCNINPLVIYLVCFPNMSKNDYEALELTCVCEDTTFVLFKEDIASYKNFFKKLSDALESKKKEIKYHDPMTGKVYDTVRRQFEPSYRGESDKPKYIMQSSADKQLPYSCLSVFTGKLSDDEINGLLDPYFEGTKQTVFTGCFEDVELIANQIEERFKEKNIKPEKNYLEINNSNEVSIKDKKNGFSIFNFNVFCYNGISDIKPFKVYNGKLDDEQKSVLRRLADITGFNINQYEVEHAEIGKDIQVRAGAGTGKTYSMVSRIAFLCSRASNSEVYDPSEDIVMLTFTKEAAVNMKSELKKLFMNYFILTGETRYLETIGLIEKMRITIHSFARDIISATSSALGVGADFNTITGTYERQRIFDRLFTKFLEEENKNSPLFFSSLPINIEELRKNFLGVAKKLYEKGCDIKTIGNDAWGAPPENAPFLNRLFEKVIVETEKEYSRYLIDNNSIALSEYMIQLDKCVNDEQFNSNLVSCKYVFIDEFQDTDDAQIASFLALQKKIGFNFFIVGDLKQSIYRFRGATMSAFEKMGCDSGDWLKFTLNINYRSDKRLLEKYGVLFERLGKEGLLLYDRKADVLTGVKTSFFNDDDLLICQKYRYEDMAESTAYYDKLFKILEEQQQRILAEMDARKDSEKEPLSEKERTIALLTRRNDQIDHIIRHADKMEIIKNGIKIESDYSNDLYKTPPSIDLCHLTSALCNPYNPLYLYDLIRSHYVNVDFDIASISGKTDEEKTKELIRCLDLFYTDKLKKTWEELIRDVQKEPALKILRKIYEKTKPWTADSKDPENYRGNYELIFEELAKKNRLTYLTLDYINNFLHISIMTGTGAKSRRTAAESKGVKIVCLTVHKSKGLEYGTVILPRTDSPIGKLKNGGTEITYMDGKIGYYMSSKKGSGVISNQYFQEETEEKESVMEEVRILYVAMTRAINNFIWFNNTDATPKGSCWGSVLEGNVKWK